MPSAISTKRSDQHLPCCSNSSSGVSSRGIQQTRKLQYSTNEYTYPNAVPVNYGVASSTVDRLVNREELRHFIKGDNDTGGERGNTNMVQDVGKHVDRLIARCQRTIAIV